MLAPDILGVHAADVTQRLEADHDNIRAAIDWAVKGGETEIFLRFLVAIWRFWQTRGHLTEARLRADAILAMDDVDSQAPSLVSRAFGAAGGIAYWQGDIPSTHRFYRRALEAARMTDDQLLIAQSLYNYSFAPIDQVEQNRETFVVGTALMREALGLFRAAGRQAGNRGRALGARNGRGGRRRRLRSGNRACRTGW